MPIKDVSCFRTPCEMLREINDQAQGIMPSDKRIRELTCELEALLKSMLGDCPVGVFEENTDYDDDLKRRGNPTYRYEGASKIMAEDMGENKDSTHNLKVVRC